MLSEKTIKRSKDFWNETPLINLSKEEWEALCDGCAKCCLHKLEDESDNQVYYTDIACNLLDLERCQCSDYQNRHKKVPNCISFSHKDIANMDWLPETCAYKLRYLNEPLYDWHYLMSGCKKSIHKEGESIKNFAKLDSGQDYKEHVIYFKP